MSRLHDILSGKTKKRSVKPWNPPIKRKEPAMFPKELQDILGELHRTE